MIEFFRLFNKLNTFTFVFVFTTVFYAIFEIIYFISNNISINYFEVDLKTYIWLFIVNLIIFYNIVLFIKYTNHNIFKSYRELKHKVYFTLSLTFYYFGLPLTLFFSMQKMKAEPIIALSAILIYFLALIVSFRIHGRKIMGEVVLNEKSVIELYFLTPIIIFSILITIVTIIIFNRNNINIDTLFRNTEQTILIEGAGVKCDDFRIVNSTIYCFEKSSVKIYNGYSYSIQF